MAKIYFIKNVFSGACRREFICGPLRPEWILPRINSLRLSFGIRQFSIIVIFMICFLFLSNQVWAAMVTATPKDSSVMFRVNHDLGYTVGYFDDFQATLETGDGPGQIVSVKAELATASIQTRNALRDQGLRSAMFLDAEKFPQATFESSKIDGDEISGSLTLKGVAQPVTLKIERTDGKILLKGKINRNDFGITYNKALGEKKKYIGEVVELIIELKV